MDVCLGASAALIESEGSSFISDSHTRATRAEAVLWTGHQLVFSTLGMLSALMLASPRQAAGPWMQERNGGPSHRQCCSIAAPPLPVV